MDYTKHRDGPPDPEKQTPAATGIEAGEIARQMIWADHREAYQTAAPIATCRHGHPWTAANTYRRPTGFPEHGRRNCRACNLLSVRCYRQRQGGAS